MANGDTIRDEAGDVLPPPLCLTLKKIHYEYVLCIPAFNKQIQLILVSTNFYFFIIRIRDSQQKEKKGRRKKNNDKKKNQIRTFLYQPYPIYKI